MGRKPNQLVHEFFNRGRKLEDASNRYEHTCKRCGALFPKGRVDALLNHLLKRCPHVTQVDRENVVSHLQTHQPPRPSIKGSKRTANSSNFQPASSAPERQDASHAHAAQIPTSAPGSAFQQPSALETLAEVSRQHLDFSSRRTRMDGSGPSQDQVTRENDRILAEQALLFGFQNASNSVHQSALPATQDANFYGGNAPPSIIDPFISECPPPLPQRHVPMSYEPSYQHEQPHISHLHHESIFEHATDPELATMDVHMPAQHVSHSPDTILQAPREDVMQWNPTNSSGRQTQSSESLIASSDLPRTGFGLLQTGSRRTARARFSEDRRKEVQELRKQGACVRCRMLKKPCSDGTPCNTCANIASARLWKGRCVRTKLAEEFTMYSTRLFYTRSKIITEIVANRLHQSIVPGWLEVRLFRDNDSCLSFGLVQYSAGEPDRHASTLMERTADPQAEVLWLVDGNERLSNKIEDYVHKNLGANLRHEPCEFMRATVQQALELIHGEQVEQMGPATDAKAPRSCYNLQQAQLLQNVVALWILTSFFTNADPPLELSYETDQVARRQVEPMMRLSNKDFDHASPSYQYIKAQLLAAVESCCSKLAKGIINELERRLLQRQQVSRFSTFIAAVILLSCAERMARFYRACDSGAPPIDPSGEIQTSEAANSTFRGSHRHDWPLSVQPSELWPQGENFAQLLVMLLRIRGLPPVTSARDDGKLTVVQDHDLQTQLVGSTKKVQQTSEQAQAAALWLDPLGLDVSELRRRRDARQERRLGDNESEVWNMAFVALVLLPENTC